MINVRVGALIGLLLGIGALAAILNRPGTLTSRGNSGDAGSVTAGTPSEQSPASRYLRAGDPAPTARPPKSTDARRTSLLGSVVAPVQAVLSARMPARITDVLVKEGDTVRSGQPLVQLDPADARTQEQTALAGQEAARAQLRKARAGLSAQKVKADSDVLASYSGLSQAQARLQQQVLAGQAANDEQKADVRAAVENVRKAQAAFDRARDTLKGLEDLAAVGGVSRLDLEGARTQQRIAQSDLDSAKAQVDRLQAGAGGVPYRIALAAKDVEAAKAAVRQARDGVKTAEDGRRQIIKSAEQDVYSAQAAVEQASAGLNGAATARVQTRLTSPIGGLVTSLAARPGETAQPGVPLATIVSLVGLRVDALVPARLLSLFRVGQHAGVSADTTPGQVFGAVITEIARIAEPDGRTFRVKFRLLDSPPLRPGQTARISVNTAD